VVVANSGVPPRFIATTSGGARRFVRSALDAWGYPDAVADAELLVSELVTNVLMHSGATSAAVSVTAPLPGDGGPGTVRVEVADPGSAPLVPGAIHPGPREPGGLGLAIVDAIASDWGVVQDDGGKTVWFELGLGVLADAGRP